MISCAVELKCKTKTQWKNRVYQNPFATCSKIKPQCIFLLMAVDDRVYKLASNCSQASKTGPTQPGPTLRVLK